jgi:hypothetical protein
VSNANEDLPDPETPVITVGKVVLARTANDDLILHSEFVSVPVKALCPN